MAGVFISYRRDDSQGFAGRLADDLGERLGAERVFRDVEIPVGRDFTDVLHRAIAASDLLLVVIGPHWIDPVEGHASRLFEPNDWVRTEVEAAFKQGKQIVPVLVGNARMPSAESLPPSIRQLAVLQAATLCDRDWDHDVDVLADHLRALCPSLAKGRSPRREKESLTSVLHEISKRVLDDVAMPPRPRAATSGFRNWLWLKLRKLLWTAFMLALIYTGIRLFGDESLLRTLDAIEARLQLGWGRLLGYLEQHLG